MDSSPYGWVLAFSPAILAFFYIGLDLSLPSDISFISGIALSFLLLGVLVGLDQKHLIRVGAKTSMTGLVFLLVPAYLAIRSKRNNWTQKLTLIWVVAALISFTISMLSLSFIGQNVSTDAVEQAIENWAGPGATVVCPEQIRNSVGASFECLLNGTQLVEVKIQNLNGDVTWAVR